MNLNIRNIDPEARGLLYRLQAEKGFHNHADTIEFLVKDYYTEKEELVEICPGCMKPADKCTGQYPICIKNGGWDNVKTKQKN